MKFMIAVASGGVWDKEKLGSKSTSLSVIFSYLIN